MKKKNVTYGEAKKLTSNKNYAEIVKQQKLVSTPESITVPQKEQKEKEEELVGKASSSITTASANSETKSKKKKKKQKPELNTMGEIMKVLVKGGDWQQIIKQLINKAIDWICQHFKEGRLGEILGEVLQQNG